MESWAVLIAAVFLVLLVLVAWHARVRAVREAQRLEAEAVRGRELESMAMDGASLLAATLQSLESARDSTEPATETRRAVDDARTAAAALGSLFGAARLYLQDCAAVAQGSADGCVRVAIAVARSRGWGISVRGEETTLPFRGRPRPACELIIELLAACRATLRAGELVEVELGPDRVHVLGGSAGDLALPEGRFGASGWRARIETRGGRCGVTVQAAPAPGEPDKERAPRGLLGAAR